DAGPGKKLPTSSMPELRTVELHEVVDIGATFGPVFFRVDGVFHHLGRVYSEGDAAKMAEVEQKKKQTFRKFTHRGVDLDQLLDMSYEQLMQLYSARQRRRLNCGLRRTQHSLLKRLRKAKKEAPPMEKPEVVKTHLHDMIILPEMVSSIVGVYDDKTFNQVEIKPEMIGHYLDSLLSYPTLEEDVSWNSAEVGGPDSDLDYISVNLELKEFLQIYTSVTEIRISPA
ncbi:unnamed protein product, partial [Eretmochelys imbricata]